MIYNKSNIAENFRGLIGFKSTYDSGNTKAKTDESLAISYSGQYINELNPLFTAENFVNTSSQFSTFTVADWDNATAYAKSSVVRRTGLVYEALQLSTNQNPETSSAYWKKTTLLSVWLREKYDGAVFKVIDKLKERKKLGGHGKELKGETPLFNSSGLKSNLIEKSGRFVGYEIQVKDVDMNVSLMRFGLQLNAVAVVPIHILYDGNDTVIELNFTKPDKFEYMTLPMPQHFNSMGGSIQIGYYEDDLGDASAIDLKTDVFSDTYCYSCGGADSGLRKAWSGFVDVQPISILDEETSYYSLTNFGLNLSLTFKCDMSDLLIRNKEYLVPALAAMLRITFLEALSWNVRNNGQADTIGNFAFAQYKDFDDPLHPVKDLERAVSALDFEFSGLNKKCIPCSSTYSFRNRSI